MFDGNFGIINDLLVRIGVLDRYVAWLSDPTGSFWVVVSAMVWYGQPLMALILLAALQTIPPELYEAARVDGAGAWRTFWHITLPHLMPSILFLDPAAHDLDVEPHRHDLRDDRGRARLQQSTPRRSTASRSPTSSRSATRRRSPWCWRSCWSRPRRSMCATSPAPC
jgi:hypothetical protein